VPGDRSPEGHLPISFDRTWEENPTHDNYYPENPEAKNPDVHYAEGLMVGYRYYTSTGKKPLFPFGYGLSYTTFSFSNLQIHPASARAGAPISVSFDVKNTGGCAGAEVAQLYVGDPSAKVERPARELKGFAKVRLAPGKTKRVILTLNDRSFAYYDVKKHDWQIDPGKFNIYVGDSSENTPLTGSLILQ
jgi:beta-glucosidase